MGERPAKLCKYRTRPVDTHQFTTEKLEIIIAVASTGLGETASAP